MFDGEGNPNDGPMIDAAAKRQYHDEGYFIVPSLFDTAVIEMLREECARALAIVEREMDDGGVDTIGLNHRRQRYIVPLQYTTSDRLQGFLFSETMAAICRATLGGEAYLFLEQFVVKGPQVGMKLGWHQDAGYLPFDPPHYMTVWVPLDDVDADNGTVWILPYAEAGGRSRVEHRLQQVTNDKIGYFGSEPGVPVIAPAGSAAVFSSTTFHRSGANRTHQPRRAYLAQYSAQPVLKPDGTGPRHFADPFLRNGLSVPQPAVAELKLALAMPWTWSE